ncbi:MAG: HYR domain-containing protein [Saprospiraceae bacterium]|nr:HYR domain-containing protein [Saprospiraceae bacterium]
MRSFVYHFLFVLSLLTLGFFNSQATTLGLGDIAFTGYNADDPDEFTFVLLKGIDANTEITFTDKGWFPNGTFNTSEGTLTVKFTSNQSCGDEFRIIDQSGWKFFNRNGATAGMITEAGSFALSASGDQIFAYQGSAPNSETASNWIAAIHMNCEANGCNATLWDEVADNSNGVSGSPESAKPSIFNTGNYSVFGGENDAAKYDCSITSGDAASLQNVLNTDANWAFSEDRNSAVANFCSSPFSCTPDCTAPTITSLTTNSTIGSNTFCPGDNVVVTVTGTPGDATTWNLYTGSCGGTLVGSTTAVNGATFSIPSISATTTYHVGGTGGCVSTPTCTPILITVNGLTANAGSDQKINGSTTASISGNGSGTWSIVGVGDGNGFFNGVSGTTSSSLATTTFTGTAGQEYELRWTVSNAGCPNSSDEVFITFLSSTTLGLGDIAFTGYNSDTPDEFRFVLLKDINAGTRITFTDRGWFSAGGFRGNEQTITYEFCRPYACGDEFSALSSNTHIKDEGGNDAALFVSGSFPQLSGSGDQVFAYQGMEPTTGGASNWIAAIQMNGVWNSDASNANSSAQPSAFTDGVNSISISPKTDNAEYNCAITTNSPTNLGAAVNTASNWNSSSTVIDLNYCSFTCGSCVEPVLTSVSAPSSACPGQTVALTINGTLNGANEWAIYTGSCGGTLVGTTSSSSFNVTPTATTTYYVSGRGGCVITESCQTATISVTSVQADAGPNDVEKIIGNTMTQLQGNGGLGDGTWTFVDPGDGQGMLADDENPTTTFEGTAGQSYTLKWTIDNSAASCPDTEDEVTIVFLSQTGLTLGDIAFVSYSADEDDVAFVILKDLNAGTTITFTDNGWLSSGGFRSGEGTRTLEFCRPYSCGDEFNVFDFAVNPSKFFDANGVEAGDVNGSGNAIDLSISGDQLFAYQGNAPTSGNEAAFIAAIQMNSGWDADATNSNNSAKPSVFTDGVNSISISPERDNATLDCSKVSVASGLQINTEANWNSNDDAFTTLPLSCNLACCSPGVVNSINGSPGPLCPSSLQTLSVVGSLNDDQSWVWYTGSCGGAEVATGPNFNVSPTVTTTYYVRAEGTCSGTSGACASITITVEDGVNPVASCPADITVSNDPGLCSALVSFNATATDNCGGIVDITYSQNPGTVFNVGTTQVDVTATDDLDNTDNCSFLVIVRDSEDPVAICPEDIMVNNDPGQCGAVVSFSASATDNCLGATAFAIPSSGGLFPVGVTPITVTATDFSGNTDVCNFTVKVNDNEAPTFSNCPGNISVSNEQGLCGANVTWTPPTLGDNCPSTSQNSSHNSGDFFSAGSTTVTYSGSDVAGNNAINCSFTVTVNDTEDPVPTCPSDISVNNDPGQCNAVVSFAASATDNCDTNVEITYSQNPGTTFNVGTAQVDVTATDNFNRTANCSFNVTVNDNEDPVAKCPGVIQDVELDLMGNGTLPANIGDGNSTDNCGAIETSPELNYTCDDLGIQTVTLTANDLSGGISTIDCSFNVVDNVGACNQPPVANCKNITVSTALNTCEASITPAQVNDNSSDPDNDPLQLSLDDSGPFGPGTYTVGLTVSDGSLSSQCTATVTVQDLQAPTFSNCPGNISVNNDTGDCGANVNWTLPTLSDNCPGALSNSTHFPDDFFPVGTTTVTYSGSDVAGNDAMDCSFTVTVADNEKPDIACPSNITTSNDPGQCGANVDFTPAQASDNCDVQNVKARYRTVDENNNPTGSWTSRVFDPSGFFPVGRYEVQWRAKDIHGNKKSCSHFLVVFDGEDPVAVCKDVTVDFNGEQDINLTVAQVWNEAASSDNCGTVEFISADLTIGCDELGNTVAIPVTIKDGAGNEDDCTAYVDVIGLPCGWSEGPDDGSLNCDGQTTSDYDVDDESFTLTSDGCWPAFRAADKATYVYQSLCGDGTLTAELASINTGGYAGLMARESLDPLARRAGVLKNTSTRSVRREYRASYGGIVSQSRSNRSRVKWLRIVRNGNEIKSYTSRDGNYWRLLYKVTFSNLDECIYLGMMAYSLNGSAVVEAVFKNVSLSGSGTLAGGILGDPSSITPEDLQAWSKLGDVENGTIEIFPNPAYNQAQIVLDGFEDVAAKLLVRDAFGKVLRQVDLDSAAGVVMPMDVQDLAPGVYLISLIQSDRLVVSKRLVIQK